MTSPVNVDVKLGVNKFNVDEEHPHIVVKADADKQALELLVKACPAGLLAVGVARDLFTIDGSAPELMRKKILRHGKKVGFINLIKDGMKGVTVF